MGGATSGLHYAYRVDGPRDLAGSGDRYNPDKVLIDPYAKGVTQALWDRGRACDADDNLDCSMRGTVIDITDYDWEGDQPLNRPMSETIIYEMHVGGFTRSGSSGVGSPGTFTGIVAKIPYLRELGVTAVELMPVFAFDESGIGGQAPDGTQLRDYWGYNTVGYFSPHSGYCLSPEEGGHINEFRNMVKALHRAGIEVILDVVFNHTSEGNHLGPVISFKGPCECHILPSCAVGQAVLHGLHRLRGTRLNATIQCRANSSASALNSGSATCTSTVSGLTRAQFCHVAPMGLR